MTFADMNAAKINAWTAWARSHDWAPDHVPYYDAAACEMVTASEEYTDGAGWATIEARHKSPKAMREWAGY